MKEEDYSAPVDQIFSDLTSSEKGLSDFESQKRIKTFGLNEIAEQKRIPGIFKFLKQFNSPLIYILFLAMIISFIFNHLVDAYVILFIVLINATIGFFQERKAERAISSLKKMIVSYAKS